jgi:formamidopyrimidine-DNA glycosylase
VPELPEVETLRVDLAKEVAGRKVKLVTVGNGRSVRRHASAKHFRVLLEGRTVKSVGRVGKYLLLALDNGDTLVVHLGMSGQLLRVKSAKEPKQKHTHVVITFTQGGELRYVDPRTFGEMFVSGADPKVAPNGASANGAARPEVAASRKNVPELAHLGFDPIEDMMSWERFAVLLRSHRAGLKALLMDQQFVAGIGNLYSDEILFASGLRFDRQSDSLSGTETRRLYRAMVETLRPSSTGARRWPTSSTATCSARSATTRASTRSMTARASPAGAAETPSSGCARGVARPSSASTARSEPRFPGPTERCLRDCWAPRWSWPRGERL